MPLGATHKYNTQPVTPKLYPIDDIELAQHLDNQMKRSETKLKILLKTLRAL